MLLIVNKVGCDRNINFSGFWNLFISGKIYYFSWFKFFYDFSMSLFIEFWNNIVIKNVFDGSWCFGFNVDSSSL